MNFQKLNACQQKQLEVGMFLTRVHPWRGTFHGKGTVGPGLSRSHPPSSAEPAASPGSATEIWRV